MKPQGQPLRKNDWWIAAAFFVVALALRVPFRSRLAYHWDSAEFSLAIEHYNVTLGQPHPPGFFLYVMFGRLANFLVGNPHASLVWVSVVFGSGLAALMYLLGVSMFDWRTGAAAGMLALTSPQLWFHSCVALMYVVDAFWVVATVFWCWWAMQRRGSWVDAAGIGVLMALVGGVRQQTVPGLAPLALYSLWQFHERRAGKLAAAGVVTVMASLVWFVPMVALSGGMSAYAAAVRRFAQFTESKTLMGGGWDAVIWNVFFTAAYCWDGLVLGAAAIMGALVWRVARARRSMPAARLEQTEGLRILAWWLVPMALLGTVVAYTEMPGHVLSQLPGWLLLAAVCVGRLRQRWVYVTVTTLIVAVNVVVFTAWPRTWDGVFFRVGRTARAIREHDTQLSKLIEVMRSRYAPREIVVCHVGEHLYFGLRLFQLHAPEYEHYEMRMDPVLVTDPARPLLRAREGTLEFVRGLELAWKRSLLLVVPPGQTVQMFGKYVNLSGLQEVRGTDELLYEVTLESESR